SRFLFSRYSLLNPRLFIVSQSICSGLKRYSLVSGVVCAVSISFLFSCFCSCEGSGFTSCSFISFSPSGVGLFTCFCISVAVSTAIGAGTLKNEKLVGFFNWLKKLEKKLEKKSPCLSTRINWFSFFFVGSTVSILPFSSMLFTAWIFFFSLSSTSKMSDICSGISCLFVVSSFIILKI